MAVFGPMIAPRLRAMRPKPHSTWHLDEMFVSIGGKMMYLWRAVDAEGEVLYCLVQSRRNKRVALRLMISPGCERLWLVAARGTGGLARSILFDRLKNS